VELDLEQQFPVAEGTEMADYLLREVQSVFDAVETIKRENPGVIFR